MINTILNGLLDGLMNVLNWFLTPIWNAISGIDLGNGTTIASLFAYINDLFSLITNTMTWVIDATGIQPFFFLVLFGVYIACLTMRLAIYIVKMILRWWDKIFA